jgi:hypothetical protein
MLKIGCRRVYCPGCDEEMIHRDHRRPWESSSSLGQVVRRIVTEPDVTFMDIDLFNYKRSLRLVRGIEHKQADSRADKFGQSEALGILARALDLLVEIDGYDERSGVYLIRGDIRGATESHRKVEVAGPQVVRRIGSANGEVVISTRDQFHDWFYRGTLGE